ncbi:ABC transporter ATP-binding protein [Anaeromicropila populeti]|uniref:ATP-binding cassette, subfamily B n=1 Tax=Anaeromicropila populeti TaxID=37658 RepID=A0A1I6JPA0_9FIRM|nr:ABC transporter ATP-binding protein [Anaeromicropila populeti]SFR80799.1 ATP-binding cassette, subfamily B [Anaeromicropila populeti]
MEKKKKEMNMAESMKYLLKTIWKADKGCVIFSFYKNCSEEIFVSFFFVYMTQKIYECIEKKSPYSQLAKVVIIFCLLHICIHIGSAFYTYNIRLKTPIVYRYIFDKVITKATTIEITRYEQPDFYDKFSRSLDECLNKAMDGLSNLTRSVGAAMSALAALLIIARVDPVLIIFVFPPVLGAFAFGVKENQQEYQLRKEETYDLRVMEYVKRVFYEKKYAGEIRLYKIRNILFGKHKESYEKRYQIHKKYRKKIAFYQFIRIVFFVGMTLFGTYIYVTYVIKTTGESKIGAYVAMLSGIGFVSWQVKESVHNGIEAGKCCLFMNNLKEFLEYQSKSTDGGTKKIQGLIGDISFHNVSFTYEGGKSKVIDDLTFTIRKGEHIALVGENGAGKTTLVKLLMGLYPVSEGKIIADGCDIREFEPKEYHSRFGTVFQDLQIFALPLGENVLMKEPKSEAEKQLVIDSLRKAQFGDTLQSLKNGINTMITKEFDEDGFVCSGGQAQKIAIARVFAKNPDVVILDEPSSALDPIAEYNMYHNMMQVSEGKTVFFISHRLSSARIADKIYFLEKGKIKESGTHNELIELNGSYAQMFRLQAQNYQESVPENYINQSRVGEELHV